MYKEIAKNVISQIKFATNESSVKQIILNKYYSIPDDSKKREFLIELKKLILITDKQQNEQARRNIIEAERIIQELMNN